MTYFSRNDWGARPATAVAGLPNTAVTRCFLHWLGGSPGEKYDAAALMRSVQNDHIDGKGWTDFAYSFAVDPRNGDIYEGRGWARREGATLDWSGRSISILILNGTPDPNGRDVTQAVPKLNPSAIASIAGMFREAQGRYPNLSDRGLFGHREAPNSTGCPGDQTVDLIHQGAFRAENEIPSEEEDMQAEELLIRDVRPGRKGATYLTTVFVNSDGTKHGSHAAVLLDSSETVTGLLRAGIKMIDVGEDDPFNLLGTTGVLPNAKTIKL